MRYRIRRDPGDDYCAEIEESFLWWRWWRDLSTVEKTGPWTRYRYNTAHDAEAAVRLYVKGCSAEPHITVVEGVL